jgi:hypothetical protein
MPPKLPLGIGIGRDFTVRVAGPLCGRFGEIATVPPIGPRLTTESAKPTVGNSKKQRTATRVTLFMYTSTLDVTDHVRILGSNSHSKSLYA